MNLKKQKKPKKKKNSILQKIRDVGNLCIISLKLA